MLIFQRKQYAVENEENTLGYSCIAVSLYDRYNDDHYAITLSSLKSLMTDEHIQQLRLCSLKRAISSRRISAFDFLSLHDEKATSRIRMSLFLINFYMVCFPAKDILSYGLTTLTGAPARNALIFSAVASMIRWRLSFGAQEMCGVMMQFFAFSSGLSARIGSV